MKVEMLVRRVVDGRVSLSVEMVDASWKKEYRKNPSNINENPSRSTGAANSFRGTTFTELYRKRQE